MKSYTDKILFVVYNLAVLYYVSTNISDDLNSSEGNKKLRRSESEYSLGLTNSKSIDIQLNELGNLCFVNFFTNNNQ